MRRLLIIFPLVLFALCAPSAGQAQVGAKATIDSASMFVGGKRTIHLRVNYVPGIRLLEPGIHAIDTSEAIELLSSTPWDTTLSNGNAIVLEKDLLLTAWDSGYFELPPIPVAYAVQSGIDTVFTQPLTLQVYLTPPDTAALMPLKPIIGEPLKAEDFIPYLIGLLAAIAFSAILWGILRRKKQAPEAPPPPAPVAVQPHALALEKYRQLEEAQLWQKGLVKEYHTQLTFILREYLEARFGILALESATSEIAEQMEHKVPETLRGEMTALLNTSDMVKFAKAEPPDSIHPQLLDNARKFINSTTVEAPSGHEPQVTSH